MYFNQKHALNLPRLSSNGNGNISNHNNILSPTSPSSSSSISNSLSGLTTHYNSPAEQLQQEQSQKQYNCNNMPPTVTNSYPWSGQPQQQEQFNKPSYPNNNNTSPIPTITQQHYEQHYLPPQEQANTIINPMQQQEQQRRFMDMEQSQLRQHQQQQVSPPQQQMFFYERNSNNTLTHRPYNNMISNDNNNNNNNDTNNNNNEGWWSVSNLQLSPQQEQLQQKQQLPSIPYERNELQPTVPPPPAIQRYDLLSRAAGPSSLSFPLNNNVPVIIPTTTTTTAVQPSSSSSSSSLSSPTPITMSQWNQQFYSSLGQPPQPHKRRSKYSLSSSSDEDLYPSASKYQNPHRGQQEQLQNGSFHVEFDNDLAMMQFDWTPEEIQQKRRLVQFWREERPADNKIVCGFQPVSQESHRGQVNRISSFCIVSCIYWESQQQCFMTSVDLVQLLEFLLNMNLSMEEKNRVRRNLEGFKPVTASKNRTGTVDFFRLIMNFPNPKPRHIEKDVGFIYINKLSISYIKSGFNY